MTKLEQDFHHGNTQESKVRGLDQARRGYTLIREMKQIIPLTNKHGIHSTNRATLQMTRSLVNRHESIKKKRTHQEGLVDIVSASISE